MPIKKICLCGLGAALLTLCAWLALPLGAATFTLQTFGVFFILGILGGKWGSLCIGIYLLLGFAGFPVFSGFRGGVGMLLGANGGFLVGFLVAGLVYRFGVFATKNSLLSMILGLFSCYAFGAGWYYALYLQHAPNALWSVLSVCVLPYLLPDAFKIALAYLLSRRLKQLV